MIEAIRNNTVFMRPGDSGAPIYMRGDNNTAYISGMAVAAAAGGTIAYGESIAGIENYLTVTLMTWWGRCLSDADVAELTSRYSGALVIQKGTARRGG